MVLLLVAATASAETVGVRDMLDRALRVPAAPRRVVSLAPSLTETVFALGAGDRLVAVTDRCDYPDEARKRPKIGSLETPNIEKILSLHPDLVLATFDSNRPADVEALTALGIPVYVVRPTGLDSILASIDRMGRLLGQGEAASRLGQRLRQEIEAIERAVAGAARPRVLYLVWGSPLIVPGRDTLITELIHRAGAESVTAGEPLAYPRLSIEGALTRRPDWVVLGLEPGATVEGWIREWGYLTLFQAVQEGRVRAIDGDLAHRPGPRAVDALRALARILHPERFP